jgi:antagonist of KipI
MSLKILKAGLLDTVQDNGRYGYQHLGVNPGGAMDLAAMQTANLLIGNEMNEPTLELFYPAAEILFEKNAFITVAGGNFSPTINGDGIKMGRPVMVTKNSVIQFPKKKKGQCCYLAVHGGFKIPSWLNSCSTNLKANAGGYGGRKLKKEDRIELNTDFKNELLSNSDMIKLPWRAAPIPDLSHEKEIFIIPGNEFDDLSGASKNTFLNKEFKVAMLSDRMGYRLEGENLMTTARQELVSSAVNFGTIQLLPNGQLIVLMADSQTTGGYPRIAHVISAHLSKISQKQPGEMIKFTIVDQAKAEDLRRNQYLHLQQLKNGSKFRLQDLLK